MVGGTPTNLPPIECEQCGAKVESVDKFSEEITCENCGNHVFIASAETRTLQKINHDLGHFKLLECIGRGGFGIVYRAKDIVLDRYVAIKLPRPDYFQSIEQVERFNREARHAAQLSHPGIVPVYEIGNQGDKAYIVSKYIDGLALSDLISEKRLEFEKTANIVMLVAEAIAFAHANRVIHRDIKPNNILMDKEENPHVADFGLSRAVEGDETITVDGAVIGTPAYMSPEQVVGDQSSRHD